MNKDIVDNLRRLATVYEDEARAAKAVADAFNDEYNSICSDITPETHARLCAIHPYHIVSTREATDHAETAAILRQAADLLAADLLEEK